MSSDNQQDDHKITIKVEQPGAWGTVRGWLIAAAVAVIASILVIMLWLARRSATAEKTKVAKLEEKIQRAEEQKRLAKNEEDRTQATKQLVSLEQIADEHRNKIIKENKLVDHIRVELTKVNSWKDLFKNL